MLLVDIHKVLCR